MFTHLSLRLRIFLFFCLIALGGLAITAAALPVGYRRAGAPDMLDAFVFSGLLTGFLLVAMVAGIWLLFDENVAKPAEKYLVFLLVHNLIKRVSEIQKQYFSYASFNW